VHHAGAQGVRSNGIPELRPVNFIPVRRRNLEDIPARLSFLVEERIISSLRDPFYGFTAWITRIIRFPSFICEFAWNKDPALG